MFATESDFIRLAVNTQVVQTAIRVSLIVGTILALINHGDAILQLSLSTNNIIKILLTYLAPYCVSTYSSVKVLQSYKHQNT